MAFHIVLVVKNPPANAGDAWDTGSIPGSGRSPGVGNGNFSSILTRKIPWTEEPGGLQSRGSQRVEYNWVQPARTYCIACAKLLQSCPVLCNSLDCVAHQAPLSVRFFTQILEWVAMPSSRGSSQLRGLFCLLLRRVGSLPLAPPGKPTV